MLSAMKKKTNSELSEDWKFLWKDSLNNIQSQWKVIWNENIIFVVLISDLIVINFLINVMPT